MSYMCTVDSGVQSAARERIATGSQWIMVSGRVAMCRQWTMVSDRPPGERLADGSRKQCCVDNYRVQLP